MNSREVLSISQPLAMVYDHDSLDSTKTEALEKIGRKSCTVLSDKSESGKSEASASQIDDTYQKTPIKSREFSSLDNEKLVLLEDIQKIILERVGDVIDSNQERLVFNITKQFCEYQVINLMNGDYHALVSEILKNTLIPDLIRSKRLIPVARRGDNEKQVVLKFENACGAYAHTIDGKEINLKYKFINKVFYNPKALIEADSSMLRVDVGQLGFSDGSPRYIFTTGLYPCICVVFFDKSQSKVLLGHFYCENFTDERLSEILMFCDDQKMKNLEVHIVGGTYEYLGSENGFLSLMNFIISNNIPTKQIFVGDTADRPKSVIVDTKDMVLYGLPFDGLPYSGDRLERTKAEIKLVRIANMRLVSKNVNHSLLTCMLDA